MEKVTISLPAELLEHVKRWQQERGLTRSEVIRNALRQALEDEEERTEAARYVRGYRESPQSAEELGWLDASAAEAVGETPWK